MLPAGRLTLVSLLIYREGTIRESMEGVEKRHRNA